eukprot:TRINITY_DN72497_c0_g1_i1.p1 TRINITY_DN72497_c0_g1~~TRINITY_DN72497_c0_g1_i1.p1  ORF type:complete len:361 (-),score=60.08 TRINITY_DN72497_c0_g1_i1:149-1231(-)
MSGAVRLVRGSRRLMMRTLPKTVDTEDLQIITHTLQGNEFAMSRKVAAHDPFRLVFLVNRSANLSQAKMHPTAFCESTIFTPLESSDPVSPWHNIALSPSGSPHLVNFVCEIPMGNAAKFECDLKAPHNPISLRLRPHGVQGAGSPYFFLSSPFQVPGNYGFIPQSFSARSLDIGVDDFRGDGKPLDALLLSSLPMDVGSVIAAQPIGLVGVSKPGSKEMDAKIVLMRPEEYPAICAGEQDVPDDIRAIASRWFQEVDFRIEGRTPRNPKIFPGDDGEIVTKTRRPTFRQKGMEEDAAIYGGDKSAWRAPKTVEPNAFGPPGTAANVIASAAEGYARLVRGTLSSEDAGHGFWIPEETAL